jgi:hypothetical protein
MRISQIRELPLEFDELVKEAEEHGHDFLSKMKNEWKSGKNRFDQEGEVLFLVSEDDGKVIGLGGLNIDHARVHFEVLRLRTHNPKAVGLYKLLGFEEDPSAMDPVHISMQMTLR